jgi:hypothetical protein
MTTSMATMPEASNSKLLSTLFQGLEWLYDRAVKGVPAFDGAGDLAMSYQRQFSATEDAVDALIKWQMAKAGTASFVSSIGGVLTLPLPCPPVSRASPISSFA